MEQSKAQLESAKLDLSYTTITSPVAGVTSYSAIAEGTYVSPQNSQLTTVSVLSPMWVNFSLSENEVQRIENDIKAGRLKLPPDQNMTVEIEQADGSLFPFTGRITFADPSYNAQTGTFLIRATVDNPKGVLRPEPVRARAAERGVPAERDPGAAARGAAGRPRAISSGSSTRTARPSSGRSSWATGMATAGSSAKACSAGDQLVVDGALAACRQAPR